MTNEHRGADEIYRCYSSVEAAEQGAKPGEAFLVGKWKGQERDHVNEFCNSNG